ncbi:arginase family protein [Sporolactobacillus sp. THM7-7]|nr:arginase family protein [Sporolactobacillus sp. THM7-7]
MLMKQQTFGILGFPWDGGASLGPPGARYAPHAIRENLQWIQNRISDQKIYHVEKRELIDFSNRPIVDYGDIDIVSYSYEQTFKNAELAVSKMLDENSFPFILGGDHSFSYPLIKALHDHCEGNIAIIQFDAHLDLVDENAQQGRFSQSSQIRRALELPRVKAENIVQIGVRNYNYPWYDQYLKEIPIQQITAREVYQTPLDHVLKKILAACEGTEKVYLTFDIDVLDPAFAPGSGGHESGGLTPMQCFELLEGLYPHIDAMDIAEVNPYYDFKGVTTSLAARIVMDCASALTKR